MKEKNLAAAVIFLLFVGAALGRAVLAEGNGQEDGGKKLAPKYRAFLAETQLIITPQEKEVFLRLKTDQERDVFIESFRKQRDDKGLRTNLSLLMFLRMVQTLNLTEDQAAKILPRMNQIEEEKRKINRELRERTRELGMALEEGEPDIQKLEQSLAGIKELRKAMRSKDEELESFLEENLTLPQRAKFILFFQEFYRSLMEKLGRARMMRGRF